MGKRIKSDKPGIRERMQHFRQTCMTVLRAGLRAGYFSLWLGLAGGTIYGMYWCRDHALNLPQYKRPVTIRLEQVPSWLQRPENLHIRQQIMGFAKIDPNKDLLADDGVAFRVARNLATCPWVEQVVSVRKEEADGILWVQCKYRFPTAWIQQEDKCYLVDGQGVRLPGIYGADHVANTGMVIVTGVQAGPPDVGKAWVGDDLQAGLRQAAVLPVSIRRQVAAVDVSNYTGRHDPQAPDIKLITQQRESEILWGHAPGEEYDVELAASFKVKVLEDNLRRYGRIDGNRAYLDIRTAPAFQPAERSASDDLDSSRAIAKADRS